ncbi:transmembrane protein 25 isoform X1 [Lates japonicus]
MFPNPFEFIVAPLLHSLVSSSSSFFSPTLFCWAASRATRSNAGKMEEEDLSLAYAARGFARYPMVGYIYKVNSTSSEEIWL